MFPGENNSPYHDLGSLEHLSPGGTKLTRLWVRTDSSFPELDGQDFAAVQSLSRVRFLVTQGTAARQASLSFTISWSLLKSCLLSPWCHPTISSSVDFSSCPQSFPASGDYKLLEINQKRKQKDHRKTDSNGLCLGFVEVLCWWGLKLSNFSIRNTA